MSASLRLCGSCSQNSLAKGLGFPGPQQIRMLMTSHAGSISCSLASLLPSPRNCLWSWKMNCVPNASYRQYQRQQNAITKVSASTLALSLIVICFFPFSSHRGAGSSTQTPYHTLYTCQQPPGNSQHRTDASCLATKLHHPDHTAKSSLA